MTQNSGQDLIVVENVSFKYPAGEEPSIKNIDLRIKKGECLLITGPTGAGKTTLVLTLVGLIPNVIRGDLSGKITTFGFDTKITPVSKIASKIAIVFDDPEAQFVMGTVKYDIVYGMENFLFKLKEMRKRFVEVIKLIRLKGLEERSSYQLSGGQKQRVAVASGLVLRPELLILDEPTGQLDPIGKAEVFNTLRELKKEGITIILVTHELEDVADIVDRILIINQGEIHRSGDIKEVFSDIPKLSKLGIKFPQIVELSNQLKLKSDQQLLSDNDLYQLIDSRVKQIHPHKFKNSSKLKRPSNREHMKSIIEVQNISFRYEYPPVWALRSVNLKIFEGEFVGIIGQNGSGKTTLVKHFNGLLKPTEGSVIIDDTDTKKASVSDLAKTVGYLFQFPSHQIFSDSVWEEVSFGLRNLGLPPDEVENRVQETLRICGIENIRDINPLFLSRGVQGKVAFASVIAMQPKVIVVDEPTTGQDWKSSLEIMNQCKELNENGRTIIAITHDMRLIAEYAKRSIVMVDGQIIFDGPTSEAFIREDVMKKSFIEPPPIIRVFNKIKKRYDIPINITTVDEMTSLLKS